jgi:hypothetical protein
VKKKTHLPSVVATQELLREMSENLMITGFTLVMRLQRSLKNCEVSVRMLLTMDLYGKTAMAEAFRQRTGKG